MAVSPLSIISYGKIFVKMKKDWLWNGNRKSKATIDSAESSGWELNLRAELGGVYRYPRITEPLYKPPYYCFWLPKQLNFKQRWARRLSGGKMESVKQFINKRLKNDEPWKIVLKTVLASGAVYGASYLVSEIRENGFQRISRTLAAPNTILGSGLARRHWQSPSAPQLFATLSRKRYAEAWDYLVIYDILTCAASVE